MASGIINGDADGALVAKIEWSSVAQGSTANTSIVTATIYARRNDGYSTRGQSWSGYIFCGGTRTEISFSSSVTVGSDWVRMASATATVAHRDDGLGWAQIYGQVTGPTGTALEDKTSYGGEWVSLDTIPRYLSITSFDIRNITINTIQAYWATSDARSLTEYSLNGSTWTNIATYGDVVATDEKSGTFNIKGLTPNTTYTLKIRCKRKDSGLLTESETKTFTTYNIATISQANNFNHGDNEVIEVANPASLALSLEMKIGSATILTRNLVTGNNVIYFSDNELDIIYKLYGNSNELTVTFILYGGGYSNSKNCKIILNGNQKTSFVGINSSVKRAKVYINVNGQIKRAVVWICENGKIKRCC